MRKRLLTASAAALTVLQTASADTPPGYLPGGPTKAPEAPALLSTSPPPATTDCLPCMDGGSTGLKPGTDCLPLPADVRIRPRWYTSIDYILYRFDDRKLPPLIASVPASAPTNVPVGAPGVTILSGDQFVDYGGFDTLRLTVGRWFDNQQSIGAEFSGFLTEHRTVPFAAVQDGSPTNPVNLGIVIPTANGPVVSSLGDPGTVRAGLTMAQTARLWGAESNVVKKWSESDSCRVDLLGGFRYLDLMESWTSKISAASLTVPNSIGEAIDEIQARSQFFGAQVGARGAWTLGRVTLSATGKLAFGGTHDVVERGATTAVTGGAMTGGVFIPAEALGKDSTDRFAVLPEGILQAGYRLTQRMDATIGYNVLYLSNAVRVADQINDGFTTFRGINSTDFCAQGVSFGLNYRY